VEVRPPRPHAPTPEEMAAHEEFLKEKVTDARWFKPEDAR
jgi:hypothetical protein